MFLHNLLNVLQQIANKMGFKTNEQQRKRSTQQFCCCVRIRRRGILLLNRCLATNTDTDLYKEFTKYAFEMGLGAMICTPNFKSIRAGIEE
jgi:hypothetical protein